MATFRSNASVVLAILCLACASQSATESTSATPVQEASITRDRIEHVAPKRDSVGPMPARFEWTGVKGAEEYQITIENEVDMLLVEARVRGTSLDYPKDKKLDPGTYFWRVEGLAADGRRIADSGRAAFVVTADLDHGR